MLSSLRIGSLIAAAVLVVVPAAGQSLEQVLAVGDSFQGGTVEGIDDIAIGDDGLWSAAARLSFGGAPSVKVVLFGNSSASSMFVPGAVSNLPGATAALSHDQASGSYALSGTTLTVFLTGHGLVAGGFVRLRFTTGSAVDGLFTLDTVPDADTFTVTHGTSGTTSGSVVLLRNTSPPDLNHTVGCTTAFLGLLQMADDGDPLTPPLVTPSVNETGLFWNDFLLLRQGSVSSAPQFGPGTVYRRFFRSTVDAAGDCVVLARVDDPAVAATDEEAIVRLRIDPGCGGAEPRLVSEEVLIKTGTPINAAGGRVFETFTATDKRSFALNNRGDVLYLGWLRDQSIDRRVILNQRAILREFGNLPGGRLGTENVMALVATTVDLNDLGDYAVQVKCTGSDPRSPRDAIVVGHARDIPSQTTFVESEDPAPDPALPGATIKGIGWNSSISTRDWPVTLPALITNSGDLIWYAEWVDGSGRGGGLFVNQKVIVRRGQAFGAPGFVLDEIGTSSAQLRAELEASPNGRYVFFEGLFTDPMGTSSAGLFRVDLGESMPIGTVEQSTGGVGCTNPYPGLTFESQPGGFLPGTSALGDFPLLGHQFQAFARNGPPTTTQTVFMFTRVPPVNYPCGTPMPPIGDDLLIGHGPPLFYFVPYVLGRSVHSATIPLDPTLIGSVWYGQAYFLNGLNFVGASNGLRFVIGAP